MVLALDAPDLIYSSQDHHVAMVTQYLNLLGNALAAAYPNRPASDMKTLILATVLNFENQSLKNAILNRAGMSEAAISNLRANYKNLTWGTPCL